MCCPPLPICTAYVSGDDCHKPASDPTSFITKYGTKRGIIAIGKVAPFGIGFVIGGGGNLVMARGVIKTARTMFDAADALNRADEQSSPPVND